jgi:hypothetical protein
MHRPELEKAEHSETAYRVGKRCPAVGRVAPGSYAIASDSSLQGGRDRLRASPCLRGAVEIGSDGQQARFSFIR